MLAVSTFLYIQDLTKARNQKSIPSPEDYGKAISDWLRCLRLCINSHIKDHSSCGHVVRATQRTIAPVAMWLEPHKGP
ncbi:hypothetical protein ACOMHN_065817 [Nucella lapillus]